MQDTIVVNNLRQRGFDFTNTSELIRYEAFERKPRILDKEPKKGSISKISDIQVWGTKNVFKALYTDSVQDVNTDCCRLSMAGATCTMDKAVFGVLKSLLIFGYSKCPDISRGCYDIFNEIISTAAGHLTVTAMYSSLSDFKTDNYFAEQIVDAIVELLFTEKGAIYKWRKVAYCDGYYSKAIIEGEQWIKDNNVSATDLPKILKEARIKAKKDKEFMKQLLKGVPSNDLIGMIYLLKDAHPEVLEPGKTGDFL